MLPKVLQYEEPTFENTYEPRVQLLEPHRGKAGFYKHASHEVNDYLSTVQSEPGFRYVLVLAMSASEYYGPNRNGDGFSEKPVKINGEWAVAPGETLADHYKTFETHANVFRHHINKDPAKGFGKPDKAFYNYDMHRVELLLRIEEAKCSDIITKLDAGEYPGVSMGCRIKYDVCNICGNKAPTRNDYCDHVNGMHPDYGMNQLLEDGRKCFVWNPSPTLFDISFVFKPADRIGYTMRKVAGAEPYEVKLSADLGAEVEALKQKSAALKKLSEIDKIIRGEVVNPAHSALGESNCRAAKSMASTILPRMLPNMEMLPESILNAMSQKSMPTILSSMSACGMCPTGKEIHVIVSKKNDIPVDERISNKIAATQGILADALSETPDAMRALEDTGLLKVSQDLVDVYTVNSLEPFIEKRALWEENLARQHVPESYGAFVGEATGAYDPDAAYYEPAMQNLHYTDPNTGQRYQTTRSAAEEADWLNTKKKMVEGAGVAALLGLGVKSLGASGRWKWLAPAGLVGGTGMGAKMINDQDVPEVQTDEGLAVPANTEFVRKHGSIAVDYGVPIASGALATFLLGQDRIASKMNEKYPSSQKITDFAKDNPWATAAAVTAAMSGGMHGARALKDRFKTALASTTKTGSYSAAKGPEVDFEDLVYKVGKIIVDEATKETTWR